MLPLNDGVAGYAIIDGIDAAWASQWRWNLNGNGYVTRCEYISKQIPSRITLLHREILGLTRGDGLVGDHMNGNVLDNRRSNLRIVTVKGNTQNRRSVRGSSSQFRGVTWDKRSRKWHAQINADGRVRNLGYFSSEKDAAEAAKEARRKLFPFAID